MKQYQEKQNERKIETTWEGPFAVKRVLAQTEYKLENLLFCNLTIQIS